MAKNLQWTAIDTSSNDDDDGEEKFNIDMSKEINDEEPKNVSKEQNKDFRRGVFTVSDAKAKEAEEDDQDDTEEAEDKTKGSLRQGKTRVDNEDDDDNDSPKKKVRAHKRIQTLLARERELYGVIEAQNEKLRQLNGRSKQAEKSSAIAQKNQWEQAVKDKESALEEAVNKADGAAVARLSRELSDATMRFNAFSAVEEEYENEEEEPEAPVIKAPAPVVPEAAKDWLKRNSWFTTDQKRHVVARMISRELSEEGAFDANDEDYWEELDKRMEKFQGKSNKELQETPVKKKGSPLGSRSNDEDSGGTDFSRDKQFSRKGNTISANPTAGDYDMSERLGVTIKDFMKEKYKYAQQDYKGYVTIDVPGQ